MTRARPPSGLTCPGCGSGLEPLGGGLGEVHRLRCQECGETFKARPRRPTAEIRTAPIVGGFGLLARLAVVRAIPPLYQAGSWLGVLAWLPLGGIVPLVRAWLADRLAGPGDVIEALGGIRVDRESRDPDNDFGPVLRRLDAPGLFDEVADVARRLGVRPPEEIRLAFLPCCGVVAWRSSRALLLGMPLLHVLTIAELRAILAHELEHLARGDATRSAGSIRFVEGLGRALDDRLGRSWGPLRAWAAVSHALARMLVGPIARGMEARADRAAAALEGGPVAASALVKVALVQPLFRELLELHEVGRADGANLYSTFRALWARLPPRLLEGMRLRLLGDASGPGDSPHPPLPDRVAMVQAYPGLPAIPGRGEAAWTLIGDPEWLEQMLDDRLYGLAAIEPTVFHRSGT